MTSSLVNDILPDFDVESHHSTIVSAPAARVIAVARDLDLSGSLLIRLLFRLRGLPSAALTARGLSELHFKLIRDDPDRAFALGLIGQFWKPSGRLVDFEPARFDDFNTPGYAKAAWTFEVESLAVEVTRLSTATRVICLDNSSRRKFSAYWTIVCPYSGIIRKRMLRSIKDAAEGR
ncbi:MAG: hypothetical protein HKN37_16490 [Rhodothermales bacterium]|nr:hypothetical protein [Rhodothermales bacterium]